MMKTENQTDNAPDFNSGPFLTEVPFDGNDVIAISDKEGGVSNGSYGEKRLVGDDGKLLKDIPDNYGQTNDTSQKQKMPMKNLTTEDEDLGIFEDTDGGDDLTDNEYELEKLRADKKKREEEQATEDSKINNISDVHTFLNDDLKPESKLEINTNAIAERSYTDSAINLTEKHVPPGRSDTCVESRRSKKTWTDPRFIQGLSLKEIYWRSGGVKTGTTTSIDIEMKESRTATRLALESREALFQRAMTLLSARCANVKQDAEGDDKLTFGVQVPKYFYMTQKKPVPMEPLKAWRGYNGNIYFEPININPLKVDVDSERVKSSLPKEIKTTRSNTAISKFGTSKDKENRSLQERFNESRQAAKSSRVSNISSAGHTGAFLDKQTVLNKFNDNMHEDLIWLEGQESTGSLAVRTRLYPDHTSKEHERDLQYNKVRIRKGSVVHKLYIENKSKQKPKLTINGGKFIVPNSLSPLLRTQTQYSLSNNRLINNSPDPFHLGESKLPPLDQIRVSLKHLDSRRDTISKEKVPYNRPITFTEDLKPFVKYSPDVVAKFAQHANISC